MIGQITGCSSAASSGIKRATGSGTTTTGEQEFYDQDYFDSDSDDESSSTRMY